MRNTDSLTYGFIGIGLIGGSVAKALRRVYPGCKIIVYNRGAKPRVMAMNDGTATVSYTHLRAHETRHDLVCRLLLEKKKHINSPTLPL